MSLKAFHLLFISAATLLAVGFGVWALRDYARGEVFAGELALGIASFVLAVALLVYGKYFLRKLKHISYL